METRRYLNVHIDSKLEPDHPGFMRRRRRKPQPFGLHGLMVKNLYPSVAVGVLFCRGRVGAYPAGGSGLKGGDEGKTIQLLKAESVPGTSPEPVRVVSDETTGHHGRVLTSTPGRPDQAEELVH